VVVDQPDPDRLADLGASDSPWIGIDDRSAAAVMAEHLLSLGHRRLGVVCFGLQLQPTPGLVDEHIQATASYTVSRSRLAGFRAAALRAGLDWAKVPVVEGTDSTVEDGEAGAAIALATSPRPTALLCLSDRLAAGALLAAAHLGLRVPDDVSIAGFDDAPPAAGLGLTTIRQPSRRKGQLAMRALLSLLEHSQPDPVSILPTELVTRRSTGPAPPLVPEPPAA
jgi:DNA-binding LacI/PurR family transcriptional regulator